MIPQGTEAPQFVKKYTLLNGGTDFLGLRQVNVEMMDTCLPGINNVCSFVRPFSVISWIYWKLYEQFEAADGQGPTKRQALEWQEKIETLFTWGHALKGVSGIPGIRSAPPKGKYVPLDFASWHRIRASTSLLAAIQYGPPAKSGSGLGFIKPTPIRSVFRAWGPGVDLAKALDEQFHTNQATRIKEILKSTTATAKDAEMLFPVWSVKSPSAREQAIFRQTFFAPSEIRGDGALARRSATVRLILGALECTSKQMKTREVREAIFHLRFLKRDVRGHDLEKAWKRWVVLQLRQSQRLAMEGLLAWVEQRILSDRDRSIEPMAEAFQKQWNEATRHLGTAKTVGQCKSRLKAKGETLEELVAQSERDDEHNVFHLMSSLLAELEKDRGIPHIFAVRILLLIPSYIDVLGGAEAVRQMMQIGGRQRISLEYWGEIVTQMGKMPLRDFFTFILENYVVSQHLAVAAGRFDGNAQRLRISLEEEGLSGLVRQPLYPRVTPDRLWIALSLMADCGAVKADAERERFRSI